MHAEFRTHSPIMCAKWDFPLEEPAFAMPIRVGQKDHWQLIYPTTTESKKLSSPLSKDDCEVATDLYYVGVNKQSRLGVGHFELRDNQSYL